MSQLPLTNLKNNIGIHPFWESKLVLDLNLQLQF